jgi:hypothetical protein
MVISLYKIDHIYFLARIISRIQFLILQELNCSKYNMLSKIIVLGRVLPYTGPFRGTSGTLGREGRGECCGHFKISVW